MKYLLSALAAVALAGPALAAEQSETAKAQPAVEDVTDTTQNRMICKREKNTGSRLGSKRVCRTAAQWEQIRRDQREMTERTQSTRWKSD